MRLQYTLLVLFCITFKILFAQAPTEQYPADPASAEQAGVPKGEVLKFTFDQSKIFPGTWREYWVYVPAQYKPDQPACVYVNQDGIQWNAPVVFDNLIHKKEMPVTIGIFVMHGKVRSQNTALANDRFNRSFEYDGLGDAYARFILEEILPAVEQHKTSDGRPIRLSKNGNDRAIGGSSSGAVCAFTAAWERPDAFTRVFSAIGTYVGIRGADRYPTLVRKYEPKPIRIYLQDGSNDLNIYAGDWWMANQTMLRAFTFAGYEVKHQWGEGGHNGKHGTAVFPEATRFLWKDWPKPVQAGVSQNQALAAILLPGEEWELVEKNYQSARQNEAKKMGNMTVNAMTAAHNGNAYFTSSDGKEKPGTIHLMQSNGKQTVVGQGIAGVNGLALSPDQSLLYVTDSASHWVWSFQIQPDGTLSHKQKFGWLYVPDTNENAGAGKLTCDREGRIYVTTHAGIQILDQTGRVNAILPTPSGKTFDIAFSGANFQTLFIKTNDKVYTRKLRVAGANSKDVPNKPDAPKL